MAKLLVVEDEPAIAMALEADLRLEGYDVCTVCDGEDASRRALSESFDLIILDLMLPGKSGLDVCREIRKAGLETAILILTAKSQEAEKVLGLEQGADDYMTKPFSPPEFRARVRALLRRATRVTSPQHHFGDMVVDFDRFELRKGNLPINLTPLEFKLLAALIRHRGVALSRDQLLDLVWGEGTYATDRVIDNHVANLRKKIESDPGNPCFLIGVRGVGYRFDG